MKYAVIYARYSCERQTEQSIEGQLRICNEFAEKNDLRIVDTYIDRAMTGTNDHRPEFQRMLSDSDKPQIWDIVLVYALDRFGRNSIEVAVNKQRLKKNNKILISATQRTSMNIDGSQNLDGIILENVMIGLAEYYSAELSQKIRRGMNESRQKGNYTGGFVLFGYRVENKKLVIHEDEAQIVRQIFSDYASNKKVTNILKELQDNGILHRGKPFAINTLYRLLSLEKYTGVYHYKGQTFNNIYPQIISVELFETVKAKIESNKYGKHKPDVCYLLKNKLKCGYCGMPVSSDSGTSKNGSIIRYYKCNSKKRKKQDCSLNAFRKEVIESLVINTTLEVFASDTNLRTLAEKIAERQLIRLNNCSVLNILQEEHTKVSQAIGNILKNAEQGLITKSIQERLQQLEEKQSSLHEKIEIEKSKTRLVLKPEDITQYIRKALQKKPRELIDLLVKEVIVFNDKIQIIYNYTKNPDDLDHQDFIFYSTNSIFKLIRKKSYIPEETVSCEYKIECIA